MDNNDQENLLKHLQNIAQPRDPYFATGGYFFVREYIRQELSKYGSLEIQEFEAGGRIHQNLILKLALNQRIQNKPPILIGAHYDAVPGSVGADDNATGVAVLLELARYFSTTSANYPIHLIAFDMEEYGLLGSIAYAEYLAQENKPLRLMISLEMLGYTSETQTYPQFLDKIYPSEGNFIALIGNIFTIREMISISQKMKTKVSCQWLPAGLKGYIVPDTRRSDHAPFWDKGYKALMVTDTANLRNPHYHQPTDIIDTLDLDFLTGVYQGLAFALQRL